jgi:hypothetical protein
MYEKQVIKQNTRILTHMLFYKYDYFIILLVTTLQKLRHFDISGMFFAVYHCSGKNIIIALKKIMSIFVLQTFFYRNSFLKQLGNLDFFLVINVCSK